MIFFKAVVVGDFEINSFSNIVKHIDIVEVLLLNNRELFIHKVSRCRTQSYKQIGRLAMADTNPTRRPTRIFPASPVHETDA